MTKESKLLCNLQSPCWEYHDVIIDAVVETWAVKHLVHGLTVQLGKSCVCPCMCLPLSLLSWVRCSFDTDKNFGDTKRLLVVII